MERRREKREILEKYYSVEISVKGQALHYQYKIRDISRSGLSVLISDSSAILTKIKVGDTINVAFHTERPPSYPVFREAEIVYIKKGNVNRYRNHYLVGMSART